MNLESAIERTVALSLLGLLGLMAGAASAAEYPVNEDGYALIPVEESAPVVLSHGELEELVGPIALYPDDLLAIVLPASTYPLQIVQAARFLEQLEHDSSLQPDEDWDDSVVALLNYPEVVKLMNDDLDWTWKLGEAVVAQQNDLIAAIESFRDRAYTAGNLKSDQYQTVTRTERVIEIRPVREEVIYVPYYEPERVVVYSPRPVYYYYPTPYPLYYYPYASDYSFASGYFWGLTTAFSIGWANDYLYVHHHSYHGHRYYGRHYYGHHYRRPPIHVHNHYYVHEHRHRGHDRQRHGDYWRPRHRGGARPGRHVARDGYYRDGGGDRHHSGSRNHRDERAVERRHQATQRPTFAPRPGADRRVNENRRVATPGQFGRTPFAAADRSPDRPRNRAGGSSRERPAVTFRQRPGNNHASFGSRRHESGRSEPARRTATHSTQSRAAAVAPRSVARKPAIMPRVAVDRARSAPSQRPSRDPAFSRNAINVSRASAGPSSRSTAFRATNRPARAQVDPPPPRAAVRNQPRAAFAGRPAAHASPSAARSSQSRSFAPPRAPAHRSSSARQSASSPPRRGGRSANALGQRGADARGASRNDRRR